jgi:hypothetical protein
MNTEKKMTKATKLKRLKEAGFACTECSNGAIVIADYAGKGMSLGPIYFEEKTVGQMIQEFVKNTRAFAHSEGYQSAMAVVAVSAATGGVK